MALIYICISLTSAVELILANRHGHIHAISVSEAHGRTARHVLCHAAWQPCSGAHRPTWTDGQSTSSVWVGTRPVPASQLSSGVTGKSVRFVSRRRLIPGWLITEREAHLQHVATAAAETSIRSCQNGANMFWRMVRNNTVVPGIWINSMTFRHCMHVYVYFRYRFNDR